MKRETAKQKAAKAIEAIVQAAKELTKAEQAYYGRKRKESRKSTILKGAKDAS